MILFMNNKNYREVLIGLNNKKLSMIMHKINYKISNKILLMILKNLIYVKFASSMKKI